MADETPKWISDLPPGWPDGVPISRAVQAYRAVSAHNQDPVFDQNAYAWGDDDGSESGYTLRTINTSESVDVSAGDVRLILRVEIEQTQADADQNLTITATNLQRNKNTTGWVSVTSASSDVRATASTGLTDEGATTDRITGSTFTFLAGKIDEADGSVGSITWTNKAQRQSEFVYVVTFRSTDLANGDNIDFRLTFDSTASTGAIPDVTTQTPNATIVKTLSIVASSASLAITADSPAVTQVHTVVASSASLAITADSPAVSQVHTVIASSASLAIAADSPTVTQFIAVTPSSANLAITADSPAVTQVHQIVTSSANLAVTADSPAVTQTHNVTASSANLAITADSPTVVQNVPVTASSASLAITADSPAFTQTHQLAASSANLAITADSPAVTQDVPVTASSASLAVSAESPAVTQDHAVTASSANLAVTADNVTVSVGLTALPEDAALALAAESPAVTQVHTIVTSSAALAVTADSPAVTQVHQVTASSANLALTADNVTVSTDASTGAAGFLSAKLLSIATPTSTGQQSYAHALGAIPKVMWLWGAGTGSSNSAAADMHFNIGMAESTAEQRAVGAYNEDNLGTSLSVTAHSDSHLIYTQEAGSSSVQLAASLVALTSTGFTLDFETVTTASHTYHMTVMGGGIDTKVESNFIDTQAGASTAVLTGSTTVGFEPDLMLNVMAFDNPVSTAGSWPAVAGGYEFAFMMAGQATTAIGDNHVAVGGSTDPRWNANVHQRGVTHWAGDNQATIGTRKVWNRTGWRGASVANPFWWVEDFTAAGFDYQSWQIGLAAWQFNTFVGGVNRKLLEIQTATSTGDVSTTGLGFQPEMLIVYTNNSTAAPNNIGAAGFRDASFSLGMALSTSEQMCAWTGSEDNVATSNASRDQDSAAVYKRFDANGATPTLQAEARLGSLDADGFTLTWVDADTEARPLFVMAIAGQAPPPIAVSPNDALLAMTAASPTFDGLTVSPNDALLAMTADNVTVTVGGFGVGSLPYTTDPSGPGSGSGVQGSNYTSQIRRQ